MALVKKEFIASNGHVLSYFISDDTSAKKAHVFWFSAFTRGPLLGRLLKTEQKFHGFKVASTTPDFSFTLIRDDSGLTGDGTYYFGKADNPYIEVAVAELIDHITSDIRAHSPETQFIGAGSSMGAYAATKFGILNNFDSVLTMVPHFDVEAAVKYCGRKKWVDWACEGATQEQQKQYIQRLQILTSASGAHLPTLFTQSALDDVGVHQQQVVPFVALFRKHGGKLFADYRASGGHSMVNASNDFIRAALALLVAKQDFTPGMFDHFPQRKELGSEKLERYFASLENSVAKLLGR